MSGKGPASVVSVVGPTWNAARTLRERLAVLAARDSADPLEVIVWGPRSPRLRSERGSLLKGYATWFARCLVGPVQYGAIA